VASKVGNSVDRFAIRPTAFTVTSTNATNTNSSGTPTFKADSDSFNLTATAVAGYNGTPAIDNTKLVGTTAAGTISGSFSAADSATGVATGNAFTYTEVGNFGLQANAIYDANFTGIDAPGDCTADFSISLVGDKYGCKIGSTAVAQTTGSSGFGRFIPSHFTLVSSSITPALGSFNYMNQPFSVAATVEARNFGNSKTSNYSGAYAKGTVSFAAENANNGSDLINRATGYTTRIPRLVSGLTETWGTGSFVLNASDLVFARPVAPDAIPDGPFDSLVLSVTVTDTEGPVLQGLDANPSTTVTCTTSPNVCTHKSIGTGATMARFGRLRLINAYGSELLRPRVEYRAEYWDGTRWTTNTSDNGSGVSAGNVATGGPAVYGTPTFSNGVGFITFNTAAAGSYDVAVNLSASGNDTSCNTTHPTGTTAANRPWLKGYWSGSCGVTAAWAQDPNARVKLGSPKAPYIYLRERY
jgi:hypothetical protein